MKKSTFSDKTKASLNMEKSVFGFNTSENHQVELVFKSETRNNLND